MIDPAGQLLTRRDNCISACAPERPWVRAGIWPQGSGEGGLSVQRSGARPCATLRSLRGTGTGRRPGRLAQRESASFTPRRSLVRSQYRPPGQRPYETVSRSRWGTNRGTTVRGGGWLSPPRANPPTDPRSHAGHGTTVPFTSSTSPEPNAAMIATAARAPAGGAARC
jgi:hypothetical protein